MPEFLRVLLIAMLPVGGNLLGSAVAELTRTPRTLIGAALHAAAGVAIALISIDFMPRIIETVPALRMVALFAAGAAFSVLLAKLVRWAQKFIESGTPGAWMVYLATAVDLLSDGLMTGASSAVSAELGLLVALSQVFANFPGGFATIANFQGQCVARRIRLIAAASFVLPVIIGAALGFGLLRGAPDAMKDSALAFVVGVLLVTTIEDLVPQADAPGTRRAFSTASFVFGFGMFAILSSYLG